MPAPAPATLTMSFFTHDAGHSDARSSGGIGAVTGREASAIAGIRLWRGIKANTGEVVAHEMNASTSDCSALRHLASGASVGGQG